MKILHNILALLTLAMIFTACNSGAPEGEKVEAGQKVDKAENATASAESFAVDTEISQINWVGAKLIGGKHTGLMKLKSGNIDVADGNITGGKFTVDMASITDTDLSPDDGKADLEGHLKSDDFFDVANYPEAIFEITSVEAMGDNPDATHKITGNFTLKGVTKSVSIPARVMVSNGQLAAKTPQFVIDRTQWGVKYGSGALGLAQDEIINDEVGLQLVIKATK